MGPMTPRLALRLTKAAAHDAAQITLCLLEVGALWWRNERPCKVGDRHPR